MLPDERKAREDIARILKSASTEMDQLLNTALTLLPPSGFKATRGPRVDEIVVFTTVGLYVKALKTFRAIQIACESGLTQDAIALLRVLFETTVALSFILKRNTLLRARMYHARLRVKKLSLYKGWKTRKGLKRKAMKADVRATEVALSRILNGLTGITRWPKKHWYGSTVPATIRALRRARRRGVGVHEAQRAAIDAITFALRDHFSGRSIWDAANSVRMMTAYETFLRYSTSFSHAEDFHSHVTVTNEGGMILKLIPGADEETLRTMGTASLLLWSLASEITKHFALGRQTELDAVKPSMLTKS